MPYKYYIFNDETKQWEPVDNDEIVEHLDTLYFLQDMKDEIENEKGE